MSKDNWEDPFKDGFKFDFDFSDFKFDDSVFKDVFKDYPFNSFDYEKKMTKEDKDTQVKKEGYYEVNMKCNNCIHSGFIKIPKGIKAVMVDCPDCGVSGLQYWDGRSFSNFKNTKVEL